MSPFFSPHQLQSRERWEDLRRWWMFRCFVEESHAQQRDLLSTVGKNDVELWEMYQNTARNRQVVDKWEFSVARKIHSVDWTVRLKAKLSDLKRKKYSVDRGGERRWGEKQAWPVIRWRDLPKLRVALGSEKYENNVTAPTQPCSYHRFSNETTCSCSHRFVLLPFHQRRPPVFEGSSPNGERTPGLALEDVEAAADGCKTSFTGKKKKKSRHQ